MKNVMKIASVFMALALLVSTLLLTGMLATAEDTLEATWTGHAGYTYLYQGKLNVDVYGYTDQDGDKWEDFAPGIAEVSADQYVEITLAADITGATTGSFTSRTWNETGVATEATTVGDDGATFILEGPLTSKLDNENLGFQFGAAVTNQPDATTGVTITVKLYTKGAAETTATAAETEAQETETAVVTETEAAPTETAVVTETEAEPTETAAPTEAEPTETAAPTETEAQPTETAAPTEAEPTETQPAPAIDWQLVYDGAIAKQECDFNTDYTASLNNMFFMLALARELNTFGVSEKYRIVSDAQFSGGDGYACWGAWDKNAPADNQWWAPALDAAVYPLDITAAELLAAGVNEDWMFGFVGEGTCFVEATTFQVYAYRSNEVPTQPTEVQTETEPFVTETSPNPLETETGAEPTATEVQPTEAEKEYHAIDSWSDVDGFPYSWYNGIEKAQVQLYAYCSGTNGTWQEFCETWPTLADNQYMEFVITGSFPGASDSTVFFDSRLYKETAAKSELPIVSVTDEEIVVRVYGPTTEYCMDPNIGLNFDGAMTGIGEAAGMHVTVTVYEEGPEPTAAPTEPTESKATTEPTAKPTESKEATEPTAKPTESKEATEPTAEPTAKPTAEPTEPVIEPTDEPIVEPTETPDETDVTATATGTGIDDVMYGDANNDGVINMKDVLTLRKYIAGIEVEINLASADANADGDINMKDVLAVRKYIAGLIDTLGA